MQFNLATVESVLKLVGPVVARAPEFIELFGQVRSTFSEKDQSKLQKSYAALIAENDAGHARLQEKLRIAAQKG